MTTGRVQGLAQLIDLHKKQSHIFGSVMNASLQRRSSNGGDDRHCPVLHEAIGQLKPDEMRRQSIPDAINELGEISTMIEATTDLIMERAETLMDQEAALDDAVAILEACGFQDIVGQRLSKVTQLLETLEERFHSLVHETGIADSEAALGEDEVESERRRKELILHGPQLTGDGVSQDEIDALLGA